MKISETIYKNKNKKLIFSVYPQRPTHLSSTSALFIVEATSMLNELFFEVCSNGTLQKSANKRLLSLQR